MTINFANTALNSVLLVQIVYFQLTYVNLETKILIYISKSALTRK